MTHSEDTQIKYLINLFEDHAREMKEELSVIKRGLYGDQLNKTTGLIERQIQDEKAIQQLQLSQKKVRYWIAGFSFAVPSILYLVKQLLGL